jgi:hypothetical protein
VDENFLPEGVMHLKADILRVQTLTAFWEAGMNNTLWDDPLAPTWQVNKTVLGNLP